MKKALFLAVIFLFYLQPVCQAMDREQAQIEGFGKHLPQDKEILIPQNIEKAGKYIPVAREIEEIKTFRRAIFFFLKNQYFGAYEYGQLIHSLPGRPASHDCIRLMMEDAKTLFYWSQKSDIIIIQ